MKAKNCFSGRLKKGSIFTSWVILFFILVMVAFLLMGVYYYSLNSVLERNLSAYNNAKAEQVTASMNASATRLAMVSERFRKEFSEYDNELLYNHVIRTQITDEISVQLEMNRDVFGIYGYLSETGEVISGNSIVKEQYFYFGYFNTALCSYAQWKDFLNSDDSEYFCFFPFLDERGRSQYKLTYVLNLPEQGTKLFVALNSEQILAGDPYFTKLLMADKSGRLYNVYGSSQEEMIEQLPSAGELLEYDGNRYISCVDAEIPGIRYVLLTEKNVLNKDLNVLQAFSIGYLLMFLMLGLALAWCFSIWQYKPLSNILKLLKNSSEGNGESNEYMQINNSIAAMLQEQAALSKVAHKSGIYLRERAVLKLINGRASGQETEELLQFSSGVLTVVRVIWNEEKAQHFKNDFELLRFAVKNVSEEFFSDLAQVYPSASEAAGTVDLLLVMKSDVLDVRTKLLETAENFCIVMKEQLAVEAGVVVGRLTETNEHLPMVYTEVLEAAMLYSEPGEIVDATTVTAKATELYNYSLQTEMEIIFHIKKGDYDAACDIVNREINEVLYRRNYPIYVIRCFMIELVGTILKAVGEIEKENENAVFVRSNNVGKLFSATTIAEMELLVQEYLSEACDFVLELNSGRSSSICEDIKQHVREHYADAEMNVNAIAEQFLLNPAYLSNMFKRNTGIKLLEYINKVRVDESKKMMIQFPQLSIEEVAEKSGFGNSRTFRRIFLKYENVSPSKFINGHE